MRTGKKFLVSVILVVFAILFVKGQIKPFEAVKLMTRGINIGNTMEAPKEDAWNKVIQKFYFDDYKNAGFTSVRIPITWDKHVQTVAPYKVDSAWMARVDTVVSWGLAKGLFIIINVHHDAWIKTNYSVANKARLDSIWSQIATHFKDKSDRLLFEIINEPNGLTQAQIDDLNPRILSIIRKTNPTRLVIFSGNVYSNSEQLLAAKIPDINDNYLIGYYHSYDPWNFAGLATGTYGTTSDINGTITKFNQVANWSTTKKIPVILDEFGAVKACNYNSRMFYYATVVEQALNHGIAFNAWDDNGDFQTYLRANGKWNDLKDIIIHTYKESPTTLSISAKDTILTLKWKNRTTENDSIFVDRKVAGAEFSSIAVLAANAAQFNDSTVKIGTTYFYRLRTNLKDSIDLYSYPISYTVKGIREPYNKIATAIPGTIEAENFDLGGLEVGYHTASNTNQGGAYRPNEGVGIEARTDGYQLAFVENGEWTSYTIKVANKGLYKIDTYTASQNGGGTYNFKIGTKTTKTITVPKTNDWTTMVVATTYGVSLDTGIQVLYFNIVSGTSAAFNIDKFVISADTASTSVGNFNTNQDAFQVFPNPASSELIVQTTYDKPSTLNIYNMLGIKLRTETFSTSKKISLEKFDNGIYVFVLKSGNSLKTARITIKH